MKRCEMHKLIGLLALAAVIPLQAHAQGTPAPGKQGEVLKKLLATYTTKAKADAAKDGKANAEIVPSVETGRALYTKRRTWQSSDPTCSGCHTDNPANVGKHIDTKKPIKPLAPSANPERFIDAAKVEKNFSEHCFDLMGRDCEAQEKGNFIAYLMSVK